MIPRPFFPTIVLFENRPFHWVSGGFLERRLERIGNVALEGFCHFQLTQRPRHMGYFLEKQLLLGLGRFSIYQKKANWEINAKKQ